MRTETHVLWSGLLAAVFASTFGCYSPSPPLGVPCSSSLECPDGQECDLLTKVCGYPTEARTLRDDTAAQFEGGALEGAFIEPGGFVGPIPYFVNGVRATGIAGDQLAANVDAITFEELAQIAPTGSGVLRGLNIDLGDGVPTLLGLSSGDDVTVLFEGEVFLAATGSYQFELSANDLGFIDLAPPGGNFARLGSATNMMSQTFPYAVTTAGWHRFRGAVADSSMFMEWELRYRLPNTGSTRPIPLDEVRARVDGLDGAIVDGFDESFAALHTLTGLVDKLDGLVFNSAPYGSQIGNGAYTLRWTAQFLIDAPGDYRFRIDTGQGHRAWIDGAQVANTYNGVALVTTTPMMTLAPGWHDVVIDAVKTGGPTGRFSFTVMEGPQFAGGGFPRDHLRPVAGRTARFSNGSNTPYVDMVDGMTVTRNISLSLPPAAQTLVLDSSFSLTHPLLPQVSVVLDPLSGANVTLVAAASLTGVDDYAQHDVIPVDRSGASFGYIVGDATVDAMIGVLQWISMTATYTGGRTPYDEASFSYTSTVREIDAARLGAVSWQTRQAPTMAVVSVRTCDEAPACEAEAWTPVLNGETPTTPGRKYFQYKFEMKTGGDVPASLDWIDLQYVGYIVP